MPPYPRTCAHYSANMQSVLHVGPVNTEGGMATVIRILHENPPQGWRASTLSTHCNGNVVKKYLKWRKSFIEFKKVLSNTQLRPDVVHIHCASDWSWWRKRRILKYAINKHSVPCVMHIHSGKFSTWLDENPKRIIRINEALDSPLVTTAVLSDYWKGILGEKIGEVVVADNPIDPRIMITKGEKTANVERDELLKDNTKTILMMGRNDPIKGHAFAIELFQRVRKKIAKIKLNITGYDGETGEAINSLGWVSEDNKRALLEGADVLLVPSKYEGQPMVIIEALSCGLPVICSDNIPPTPSSVVRARGNDIDDWESKLINILNEPPSSNQIISDSQPHQLENVRNNWLQIYSTALSK